MFTKRVAIGMVLVVMMGAAALPMACAQEEAPTPENAVETFYTWYLGLLTPDETGEWENPLMGAYRESDALTRNFIAQVDELLASFTGGGYDPFICAQNIPGTFMMSDVEYDGEDVAQLVVTMDFANYHAFTVELVNMDDAWLINDVVCGAERTPEHVVQSFYTWYLGYTRWDGQGTLPNPMVDGAYRFHSLLSDAFIAQVDELLASFEGFGHDPFVCAQDVPTVIMISDAEIDDDTARISLTTNFPNHEFAVELAQVDEEWMIDNIVCGQ